MKMHHFSLCVAMVLTFAVTGPPAMAQTPDGTTPAVEGICDSLKDEGITKGLYGLCVAYCEAQDLSSEDVPRTDEEILALLDAAPPIGSILANYEKRRTATDPEMPCIVRKQNACPCWTTAEAQMVDGIRDDNGNATMYTYCPNFPYGLWVEEYDFTFETGITYMHNMRLGYVAPDSSDGPEFNPPYSCSYLNTANPTANRGINDITLEEFNSCITVAATAPVCP